MDTTDDIHALIEQIYLIEKDDSAIDSMLDHLAQALGARHAVIGFSDPLTSLQWRHGSRDFRTLLNTNAHAFDRLYQKFSEMLRQMPVFARLAGPETFHSPDEIFLTAELKAEMKGFMSDWEKIIGHSVFLGGTFNCSGAQPGFLGLSFDNDTPEAHLAEVRKQAFWLRHLSSSFHLRSKVTDQSTRLGTFESVLDRLMWGVVATDQAGRVLSTNQAAGRVMEDWPQIWVRAGKLVVPDILSARVAQVMNMDPGAPHMEPITHMFEDPATGNALLVYAIPLHAQSNAFGASDRGMTYFLQDVRNHDSHSVTLASRLFNLTDAEAECMVHFLSGATRQEVAEKRDVSLETVRSQAASIIRKTGAPNMTGAIARFMHFNPPIIPPSLLEGGDDPFPVRKKSNSV